MSSKEWKKKIKEHMINVPTYVFISSVRQLKYRIANWLMDDMLDRVTEWYNELCELMDIDVKELAHARLEAKV